MLPSLERAHGATGQIFPQINRALFYIHQRRRAHRKRCVQPFFVCLRRISTYHFVVRSSTVSLPTYYYYRPRRGPQNRGVSCLVSADYFIIFTVHKLFTSIRRTTARQCGQYGPQTRIRSHAFSTGAVESGRSSAVSGVANFRSKQTTLVPPCKSICTILAPSRPTW